VEHEQNIPREGLDASLGHEEMKREKERAIKQLMPNKDLMRLDE
jgi:hypothetical protein